MKQPEHKKAVPARASPLPALRGPRAAVAVACALYLLLGIWYSLAIPFGQAPDESAHLPYVAYLAEQKKLPVFRGEEGSYEFHQPPLFYAAAALVYSAARHLSAHLPVRLLNVAFGLGVIVLTWLLVKEIFPGRPWLATGSAALVALLPMHVALAASVTNDIMSEAFFAAVLWICARALRTGWTWGSAFWAGLLTGLAVLTKSICVALLPAVLFALGQGFYRAGRLNWKPLTAKAALFLIVFLSVAGWWLLRNQRLYGDPVAMNIFLKAFENRPKPDYFFKGGLGLSGYLALVAGWTFASFWGVFGNMKIFMPTWQVYFPLGVLSAVAAAGFFVFLLRWKALEEHIRASFVLLFLAALLLVAFYLRFNLTFFQAQARYLFPLLPAAAMWLTLGISLWLKRVSPLGELLLPAVCGVLSAVALPLWILPHLAHY